MLQNTKVNMKNEKSKSKSKKIRKRKRKRRRKRRRRKRRKRKRKKYGDNFEHYILIKYQDISKIVNTNHQF